MGVGQGNSMLLEDCRQTKRRVKQYRGEGCDSEDRVRLCYLGQIGCPGSRLLLLDESIEECRRELLPKLTDSGVAKCRFAAFCSWKSRMNGRQIRTYYPPTSEVLVNLEDFGMF